MMIAYFAPGEKVRVTIDQATVIEQSSTYVITVRYACILGCLHDVTLPLDCHGVTVTRMETQ